MKITLPLCQFASLNFLYFPVGPLAVPPTKKFVQFFLPFKFGFSEPQTFLFYGKLEIRSWYFDDPGVCVCILLFFRLFFLLLGL